MLQLLDSFSKALVWTLVVGLGYVVMTQARPRDHRRDVLSATLREYLITTPVLRALLMTGLIVAGIQFLLGATLLPRHTPAALSDADVVRAYALPEANVSVVEVTGPVSQRPANGVGQWQIGAHTFSTDANSSVSDVSGQPVIACLVQVSGGNWRATAVTDVSRPPRC